MSAGSGFKAAPQSGRQAELGAGGAFAPLDAEGRRLASDAVPLFAGLSNDFGEQKTAQRVADDQLLLEPDDQESSRTLLELKNDRAEAAAPAAPAPPVTAGAVVAPVPVSAAPAATGSELRPPLPAVAASLPAHLTVTMVTEDSAPAEVAAQAAAAAAAAQQEMTPQTSSLGEARPAYSGLGADYDATARYGYYGDFYKRPEPVRPAAATQYDVSAQLTGRPAVARCVNSQPDQYPHRDAGMMIAH